MAVVVMKFGGTSVANIERIRNVARHVKREVDAGNKVAVVVSAMSGVTNQLVGWVKEASANSIYDPRRVRRGRCDRRTGDGRTARHRAAGHGLQGALVDRLAGPDQNQHGARLGAHSGYSGRRHHAAASNAGEIAVVTGFQGIEPGSNRVSTLGRGGSDTRAVAMAVALKADVCDIYTDVDGVYTTDPRIVPKARRLPKISYEEMLEMASLGSKVLQTRSVELGYGLPGAHARAVELRGARGHETGRYEQSRRHRHNRLRRG